MLLGKEVEGVSKCCSYWVLTFLSTCHRQDGLFWVNTANNSRRLICRGCCSLNLGTVWLLTLPSCSISPCVSMLFCNYYCQASVLPCQLFGRAQLITDIEAASQKEKKISAVCRCYVTYSATCDTELSIRGRPEWEIPTTETICWKSKKWRVESDQNVINLQHYTSCSLTQ